MSQRSFVVRTLTFAGAVCVVCAVLVSGAAVALQDRQQANVALDRQRNILLAAGAVEADAATGAALIEELFDSFEAVAVDLRTGQEDPDFEVAGYDAEAAQADPTRSEPAPANSSRIQRVPHHVIVYKRLDERGSLELVVLPIQGYGLWGTMYGFLALDADLETVRGLTYYDHKETPGLGGEVNNPRWQAHWPGRVVFDEQGAPAIQVIKGAAGPPETDPHRVDGLSGATLTSRGVTNMLQFWLGDQGLGPYLAWLKEHEANG